MYRYRTRRYRFSTVWLQLKENSPVKLRNYLRRRSRRNLKTQEKVDDYRTKLKPRLSIISVSNINHLFSFSHFIPWGKRARKHTDYVSYNREKKQFISNPTISLSRSLVNIRNRWIIVLFKSLFAFYSFRNFFTMFNKGTFFISLR